MQIVFICPSFNHIRPLIPVLLGAKEGKKQLGELIIINYIHLTLILITEVTSGTSPRAWPASAWTIGPG